MKKRIITSEHINNFKLYLYEAERSENTIKKYIHDINTFIDITGENNIKKGITKNDVLEYKRKLCRCYAPRSVNSMLSSVNAFFEFADWNDLKVKTVKIQKQIFTPKDAQLTKKDYMQLIDAALKANNMRMYYLMQTICSTGIRISELKFITAEAVKNGAAVINCKGKMREVLLPPELCKMLLKYIKTQNIQSGAVFVTKTGAPVNRSNVWSEMKKICIAANVKKEKVHPHSFRRLFARTYYEAEKDIVRLADILGHSNVNTTRIYTMETSENCMRQIQKLGLLHINHTT